MYDKGEGVPQDYQEALRLYRMAADRGNAAARTTSGHVLLWASSHSGLSRGGEMVSDGRRTGEPTAQLNPLMYFSWEGVAQDYVQAHLWLNLASASGNTEAGGRGPWPRPCLRIRSLPHKPWQKSGNRSDASGRTRSRGRVGSPAHLGRLGLWRPCYNDLVSTSGNSPSNMKPPEDPCASCRMSRCSSSRAKPFRWSALRAAASTLLYILGALNGLPQVPSPRRSRSLRFV
jgi:TPR repeat protein